MQETVLGVALPIVLLAIFEVVYRKMPYRVPEVVVVHDASVVDEQAHGKRQSALAIKTVAYALLGVGLIIFVLGLLATHGRSAVLSISMAIVLLGAGLLLSLRNKHV